MLFTCTMILTLCYVYATLVQWWRLGVLRQRLGGTLHGQNALLLCTSTASIGGGSSRDELEEEAKRSLENLLYQQDGRIACTVVPRQKLHLAQWAAFPKDRKCFPLHYRSSSTRRRGAPRMHLLLQASLEDNVPAKIDFLQMEQFGELVAWRAHDYFEVVLRTDLERIAVLMNSFRFHALGINHDLPLIKVETVDVEGAPGKLRYDRRPSKLKFAHGPAQIQEFAACLRRLYAKLNENLHPKITIENGGKAIEMHEKKPISEVKPIKKQTRNTLDVHRATTGHKKKSKEVHAHTENTDTDRGRSRKKEKEADEKKLQSKRVDGNSAKEVPKEKKMATVESLAKNTLSVESKKSYSDALGSTIAPKSNLQRQNATSSKETSPSRCEVVAKPPNILVYADTSLARESVKALLRTIVGRDRYTIYDLPAVNATSAAIWCANATLVVVCGQVPAALTPHLVGYLVGGGRLLCLCSDLLYSVLHPFSTAEVREHELVRFTYGAWRRVRMMHHIFCYQASPARKQFSREASDQSMNGGGGSGGGSSPVTTRTPAVVDVQHDGRRYAMHVQVLGAEETWQTPSLLLASVHDAGGGKAVFSQVHLEVDPTQYQDDESTFAALTASNQARLEIMQHLLSTHLDLDCSTATAAAAAAGDELQYTPGYFLGRHDLKMQLINGARVVEGRLRQPELEIAFVTRNVEPPPATVDRLPVLVLRCPTHFATVEYFDALTTTRVGRLVIYADVLTSTQRVLGGGAPLADGLAVIARRQTLGRGRGDNEWLSPLGCAMFSLQLHVPLASHLGRALPLVQHLVAVAVARALKTATGLDKALPIGVKWPNDVYANGNVKVGGVIAVSTVEAATAVVAVGCGVNLDNRAPTICVNDVISAHGGERLSPERFFAAVFNEVERLVDETQAAGVHRLLDAYYAHWLHTDARITVTSADGDGDARLVTVRGVDAHGFLLVEDDDGTRSSVQPDGNTFDMLRGLIAPRLT